MESGLDANWIRVFRSDGITAYAKDLGVHAGRIHVQSEQRPLKSVVEIAEELVRELRASDAEVEIEQLQKLVTEEGEWAAMARLRVQSEGITLERTLGLVYGDEFYAKLDGMYLFEHRKRFRNLLRQLVLTYPLRLGTPRRRRFLYTPPSGWQPVARGLSVRYFPRRFPNEYGCITVLPAAPLLHAERTANVERFLNEDLLADFVAQQPDQQDKVSSNAGLLGDLVRRVGLRQNDSRPVHIDTALLRDTRYIYQLRLETRAPNIESHRRTFLQVVRSVSPIPQAATEGSGTGKMGQMWND